LKKHLPHLVDLMIQLGEHLVLKDIIGWLKAVKTTATIFSLEHLWTGDQADR
jgi:hypothetical protein